MTSVEGHVDDWDGSHLTGWACTVPANRDPLTIEIVATGGAIVATARADMFRGDLASVGKRAGRCAFSAPLDAADAAGPFSVRLRGDDIVAELPGGPFGFAKRTRPDAPKTGRLNDPRGANGYVDFIDDRGIGGWVHEAEAFARPVKLLLRIDGKDAAQGEASAWRHDVEDFRRGDGRVGFHFDWPDWCRDGKTHGIELLRGDGSRLHSAPLEAVAPVTVAPATSPLPAPPRRSRPTTDVELSVIVNFYNMHREAERTLTSLSRTFQNDIEDLSYEVICIDNGSTPAMTEESVTRHGPEFRLVQPSSLCSSPIFALNEAAASARGRYIAMMIDGAHLLSPSVLAEAMAALRSEPRAMVAVRHWFVGGDQRWLSAIGYSRDHEDLLFAKIGWPDCGYDIFKISAPIFDSPNTWFDSLSESNCLFLAAADFAELAGYHPGFDIPGGGFANLDLFARASRLPGMVVIALIGEATFHQYHGGTTTNVSDAEKEQRVRRYSASFETLRGEAYDAVDRSRLRFRGRIHNDFSMNARQRPSGRVRLGLTDAIRPMPVAQVFEQGARDYATTAYVESGGPERTIWAGLPTGVAPADLIEIQQTLWDRRPDVLVMKDVQPGLVAYIRSILPAIRLEGLKLIWLTRDPHGSTPPGTRRIVGELEDLQSRRLVQHEIGAAEGVCVLFQPHDDEAMPTGAIARYAALVTAGDYLIVLGAAFGQPGIAYSTRWTANAIHRFIRENPTFVVDRTMNAHLVSTCPSGFLRRRPETRDDNGYDEELDSLEGV